MFIIYSATRLTVATRESLTLCYGERNSFGFEGLITPESKQWENTRTVSYSKKEVFPRKTIRLVHGKLLVTTCKQIKLENVATGAKIRERVLWGYL